VFVAFLPSFCALSYSLVLNPGVAFRDSNSLIDNKELSMKYLSIMNSKTLQPLVAAVFFTLTGSAYAQINSPGQGDAMQRPFDSMQPPVIPGRPYEEGTTRGEEAERKNRFERNQRESLSEAEYREHRKEGVYDYGTDKKPGAGTGSGGY
jgi:hypothetical protein